jgi:hypothetical protein
MVYAARSVFLLAYGFLLVGVIWLALILSGVLALPVAMVRPEMAVILAGLGLGALLFSRRAGAGAGPVATSAQKDNPAVPSSADRRGAYRDMLASSPAARLAQDLQSKSGRKDLLQALLRGKAQKQAQPGAADDAPTVTATPPAFAPIALSELLSPPRSFAVDLDHFADRSWIGGMPELPAGHPWPKFEGRPARFIAQIDLADLEVAAPGAGALVIFAAQNGKRATCLQVSGDLQQTPPPHEALTDALSQDKPGSGAARLADMIGPEAVIAPRWALVPTTQSDQPAPSGDFSTLVLGSGGMTDPGFLPFDWPTALALLDAARAGVHRSLKRWEKQRAPGLKPARAEAERSARQTCVHRLRQLSDIFEACAAEVGFSQADCDRLIAALAQITDAGWQPRRVSRAGIAPRSVLVMPFYRGYRRLFEAQARRVWSAGGTDLPQRSIDRLMPLWQASAAATYLELAGAGRDGGRLRVTGTRLIDLPGPSLTAALQEEEGADP